MSAFTSSSLVLVTGANGHVAQHVVDQLLAHPAQPRVRATVRSASASNSLKTYWASQTKEGRLEVLVVPDIVGDGAFDEAVHGVTHIAHVASPFVMNVESTERDMLQPAIRGTRNILIAASRVSTVQSVVITSSFAAVGDTKLGFRPGYTYTSADWNPISYEEAADPKLDLSAYWPEWRLFVTYCASKALAERAAWEYHAEHKLPFALTVINPVWIGGPYILPLKGAAGLSTSVALLWKTATDSTKLMDIDFPHWCDVRDVAKAHIAALERADTVGGKRFILTSGPTTYEHIATLIRKNFSGEFDPCTAKQKVDHYEIDASPALTELGLGSYIPFERTVVDTIASVIAAEKRASK